LIATLVLLKSLMSCQEWPNDTGILPCDSP